MKNNPSFSDKLRQVLQTKTVMSLKQLREILHRPRSSLFRDLKQLDVISSYSHAGQYHALTSAATFDQQGLWFYNDIGFSVHGTLKATLIEWIAQAEIGKTHKELKMALRVAVQNTLTELVKSNSVGRRQLPNQLYLYVSKDISKAEEQFQRRLSLLVYDADTGLPSQSTQIDILLEIIRSPDRTTDEKLLGSVLRKRGISIKDQEVACVLIYYDIKKNRL